MMNSNKQNEMFELKDGFLFELLPDFERIQVIKTPSELAFNQLKSHFRRKPSDSFMNPLVRRHIISGEIPFLTDVYLPIGLWGELKKYVEKIGYKFICKNLDLFLNSNLNENDVLEFISSLLEGSGYELRQYQAESILKILEYRYSSQQVSTSSGKTIISFCVYAYLLYTGQVDTKHKFCMIVPRASLVEQTYQKFAESYNTGYITDMNIVKFGGDAKNKFNEDKFNNANCIITTYQTLSKIDPALMKDIKSINVDEAHTAKTDSITNCIRNASPLRYRFGLSGTLFDKLYYSEYFSNLKNLGPVTMVYDPKDLINDGFAPFVNIRIVNINYQNRIDSGDLKDYFLFRNTKHDSVELELKQYKDLYRMERDMILCDEERLNSIIEYIKGFDKNTLILYNDVKGEHGKKISDRLNESGVETKYIDGGTKVSVRGEYTDDIEEKRMNLVASYGTFSTGIDLKNVHYIVLAESFKSATLIGQSIGRGLRSLTGKTEITVIDFVDKLYKHTEKQSNERIELYKKQNYSIKYDEISVSA